jgi:hypothetical protein
VDVAALACARQRPGLNDDLACSSMADIGPRSHPSCTAGPKERVGCTHRILALSSGFAIWQDPRHGMFGHLLARAPAP